MGDREGEIHLPPPRESGASSNFRLTDFSEYGGGSAKERFFRNLDVIQTLKDLEEKNRQPTEDEKDLLSKYVGWGGLPEAFTYKENSIHVGKKQLLKELLTDEEYAAARGSTVNAHYTPPEVIRGMFKAVEHFGITGGHALEPACGAGHFLGLAPENMRFSAVELDSLSARIAKQLYPRSNIYQCGFEKSPVANDTFDLAISNVPFGNYSVFDPDFRGQKFAIHDYFFAKALQKVRPGGLVTFITSHYTLDKQNSSVREYLAEQAEFLGAIRLPKTAFQKMANTSVTADILMLRRLEDGESAKNRTWIDLGFVKGHDHEEIPVNRYFAENPHMMLGRMTVLKNGLYGGTEAALLPDERPLTEALDSAIENLPKGIYQARQTTPAPQEQPLQIPENLKEHAYTMLDGTRVAKRRGNTLEILEGLPIKTAMRMRGLIWVRDAAQECLLTQLKENEEKILQARQKLNETYDQFTMHYGAINLPVNSRTFQGDPDLPLLRSLEHYDPTTKRANKAAIFTERTIESKKIITSAESPRDALLVSLNETGRVDLELIQKLLGRPPEEFLTDLKGVIFQNPETNRWETDDEYLSGNVRQKLNKAEAAAKEDSRYQLNVDALKDVQPVALEATEIDARLGTPWIPCKDIEHFVEHLLKQPGVKIFYSSHLGTWALEAPFSIKTSVPATTNWGTDRMSATSLIDDALNLRTPTIYDSDSEGNRRLNIIETAAAREKQEAIKERFSQWLWEDDARRERLVDHYNKHFNNISLREYNGDHLVLSNANPGITLLSHQKAGVWRILQNQNTLLALAVGAGKTFTMVSAAMELKRLGVAHKPMIVVPNHMLSQFSTEFLQLYPAANILVAGKEDFRKDKRAELFSRIGTGNWDAVIVTHSGFERIPMSDKAKEKFIKQQIKELENAIGESDSNRLVKDLEKAKKRLKVKLETLEGNHRKDNTLTFEQIGVDRLFIDEAHHYKNLFYTTKMTRVAGLPQTASLRASDLFLKCQYIQNLDRGGIIFATATPIANSVAEMFTIQRYLQPKALQEKGLSQFDSWAATFGETVTAMELAPDGSSYRMNTRFARFLNVPELMNMFREVADVRTANMLKLPIPKLEQGTAQTLSAPASPELKQLVESLAKRAEKLKTGSVDPRKDNMLKITTEGRKAALDLRVLKPFFPDVPSSKVNQAVQKIYQIWEASQEKRLTQMVFCDLSKPKPSDGRFSVYEDMRTKLMLKGIPREEIAFIHDYEKDISKLALFQKLRSGEVRILFGSTQKMGTGTNAQRLLCALHHMDAPWRPADIEQREGRILRQGNLNATVNIFRHVTEGSFDAYMWQTLETKAKFIAQVMTGDSTARRIEDLDSPALSYAEVKAIASGNPLVLEKAKIDSEAMRLSLLESQHNRTNFNNRSKFRNFESLQQSLENRIVDLQEDVNSCIDTKGELFRMRIGNQVFKKRKAAGEILFKKIQEGKRGTLGEIAGLSIEYPPGISSDIFLRGKRRYTAKISESPTGTISSLERVAQSIGEQLQEAQEHLSETIERCKQLAGTLRLPFEHTEQLSSLRARQKELEKILLPKETQVVTEEQPEQKISAVKTST